MTCPQCGHEVPDGQANCPACGRPVWEPAQTVAPSRPVRPRRDPRRVRIALVTLLAAVLVGGGVAGAGVWFGWFGGGGTHPYDVMPASVVSYVQFDLNPSAEQKFAAWNFLKDVPEVEQAPFGGPDPRRLLWALKDRLWVGSTWTDFDTDVAPWLGDRIGVGMLMHDTEQILVTAIQVTDENAAMAKLQAWLDATGSDYELSTRDGYVVITAKKTASIVHAEQATGLLNANQTFRADLRAAGENGWLAGWIDFGAISAGSPTPSDATGRTAFALRFSGDTMEVDGTVTGWNHTLVNGSGHLGDLPATTGSAVCVTGAAKDALQVPSLLPLPQSADWWGTQHGFSDDDIDVLLGHGFCVSTPSSDDLAPFSSPDVLGLRAVTPDPSRALTVLRKGSADMFDNLPLGADRVDGTVVTAATSTAYLAELTGSSARLSGTPHFGRVVPESGRAALAMYLDLGPIGSRLVDSGSPYERFARSLEALGGQYVDAGAGNGSWSIRVVRA